jgi:hypothetical protein
MKSILAWRRETNLGASPVTCSAPRPEVFTPDLAMSLNTLAIRLSELGWRRHWRGQEAAELHVEK